MRERNLYRGTSDFQGSIDENGRIYDERHRFVGRIEGNVVYDYCNIKQGTIDENGKLWDVNHTYVGQERGNNFIGPSYQSIGMTRGDSAGEGNGSEYGALMMLKKRNEYYSGSTPDSNYDFGNDYSSNDDEEDDDGDEDDYGDDDYGDDRNEDIYVPPPRARRSAGRGPKGKSLTHDDPEASCFGCGCLVLFVIGIFIVLRLYSGVPFSQW